MRPTPSGSYVQPRAIGDSVFCPCGSLMFAVYHETLDEQRERWLYWCCHRDGGHASHALPLPSSLELARD